MTSGRIILIILGILLLLIVLLSNSRLSLGIKDRVSRILPIKRPSPTLTLTPTKAPQPTISPQPETKGEVQGTDNESVKKIPTTGPETAILFLLGGSLTSGIFLRKFGSTIGKIQKTRQGH